MEDMRKKVIIGIVIGIACVGIAIPTISFAQSSFRTMRLVNQAGEAASDACNFKQEDAGEDTIEFSDKTYYQEPDGKMYSFDENGQAISYRDHSVMDDETAEDVGVDVIKEIADRVFETLTDRTDYTVEEPEYSEDSGIYRVHYYHYTNGYKSNDAIFVSLYRDGSLFSYHVSGVTFENEEEITKVDDAFIEDAVAEYFSGLGMEVSKTEYTVGNCMYAKEDDTLSFLIDIYFGDTINQIIVPL